MSNIKKPAFGAHAEWNPDGPTRIWFLRHGETDWNIQRRIQGWKGTGLNAMGLAQAAAAHARLKSMHFDVVMASDLKRCLQTAQAATAGQGLAIERQPLARERFFGDWEGRTLSQVFAGKTIGPGKGKDPFLGPVPHGETMGVFSRRIDRLISLIEREHAGKSVLVVTHGGPVRIAACLALGLHWRCYHKVGRPGNTALSLVMSQGGTRWLEMYNDVSHLMKEQA